MLPFFSVPSEAVRPNISLQTREGIISSGITAALFGDVTYVAKEYLAEKYPGRTLENIGDLNGAVINNLGIYYIRTYDILYKFKDDYKSRILTLVFIYETEKYDDDVGYLCGIFDDLRTNAETIYDYVKDDPRFAENIALPVIEYGSNIRHVNLADLLSLDKYDSVLSRAEFFGDNKLVCVHFHYAEDLPFYSGGRYERHSYAVGKGKVIYYASVIDTSTDAIIYSMILPHEYVYYGWDMQVKGDSVEIVTEDQITVLTVNGNSVTSTTTPYVSGDSNVHVSFGRRNLHYKNGGIYLINADGSHTELLPPNPPLPDDDSPEWGAAYYGLKSHRFIAPLDNNRFVYNIYGNEALHGFGIYDFSTGKYINIPDTEYNKVALGVSGNKIYYINTSWVMDGFSELFTMDSRTFETASILNADEDVYYNNNITFSDDGRYIIVTAWEDMQYLYIIDTATDTVVAKHRFSLPRNTVRILRFTAANNILIYADRHASNEDIYMLVETGLPHGELTNPRTSDGSWFILILFILSFMGFRFVLHKCFFRQ
jgi:hypothetical protein